MIAVSRILLIMGGGIAAYKCLDLIRRLRERNHTVRVVMTKAAAEFITPLSVGALTNERVFTELFDLDDECEIGHIRLSREADVLVVAPATADLLAKMAHGLANDLASTVLLATDKPVLVAPAMNPKMWLHPATQRNMATLVADGVTVIGPGVGEMAERGEAGPGRLGEVPELVAAIEARLEASGSASIPAAGPLAGRHVLVTSGPTHEPIDPVRYIANRSSGKQGHAIAAAAASLGARVTLVSGPVAIPDPPGVFIARVETAADMLAAVTAALPADIAIFAAAVADWRVDDAATQKIKKTRGDGAPKLALVENTDILRHVATLKSGRPSLVIGFAAETHDIVAHAKAKLASKGADWIVANDVSHDSGIGGEGARGVPGSGAGRGVMGGDRNAVHLVSGTGIESWPEGSKAEIAQRLMVAAAAALDTRAGGR
ncbi:MAG: bifunctional phosphopantothenoylcysteine decarboxylase/phosphopantothenate--cysteine ligase CoaBC [Hyphomicrobium aestuarii]|nr:bifunctional phosphopantothenoylcysteine decarboxylase/phosphopantothenate--cysteine ligase CoaBC [Hyphomicrobium aestuarii]